MAITVKFRGYGEAVLGDEGWTAENKKFQTLLNKHADQIDTEGSDPWPALTVAKGAAKFFRGRITDQGQPPRAVKGRVY